MGRDGTGKAARQTICEGAGRQQCRAVCSRFVGSELLHACDVEAGSMRHLQWSADTSGHSWGCYTVCFFFHAASVEFEDRYLTIRSRARMPLHVLTLAFLRFDLSWFFPGVLPAKDKATTF